MDSTSYATGLALRFETDFGKIVMGCPPSVEVDAEPFDRRLEQCLPQTLMLEALDRLADKGLDQQGAGLVLGNAAGLEVEKQILVDLARGRAVAAHHVIGEDLKLRLRVELSRLGEQQRLRHLLAVGLLRAGRDDNLALEHAARLVVEHGLEQLAARAARNAMLDEQSRVAMLMAAHQKRSRHVEGRSLAGKGGIDLAAGERSSGRELEGLVVRIGVELHEPSDEVEGCLLFALELDVGDASPVAHLDLGHRVSLQLTAD